MYEATNEIKSETIADYKIGAHDRHTECIVRAVRAAAKLNNQ